MKHKLFLLDAYALIFRFHYAFITSPMRNPEGRNVSAVFGFVKFLQELIEREKPEYIGVAFDPKGGNFRHQLYPEYKANRDATPEDIIYATPIIKEILGAMCIPVLEVQGYEADDVIGTLSKKACQSGEFFTYMVTSDKDYGQLVNDCTVMYKPSKGGIDIWGVDEIREHFGIAEPRQLIDFLAIAGDSADNFAGVAGIGEKGAQKLIAEYGSVDNIIKNLENIKGAAKGKIEKSLDMMKLSRELATICREVPLEFNAEELRICGADVPRLREIYMQHNFRAFLQRLDSEDLHLRALSSNPTQPTVAPLSYSQQKKQEVVQTSLFDLPQEEERVVATPLRGEFNDDDSYAIIHNTAHNYIAIQSSEELVNLVREFSMCEYFALDTETTSTEAMRAELVGISLAKEAHTAYWIATNSNNRAEYLEILKPLLQSDKNHKVGQNIKYDMEVLANYGIEIGGRLYDTMIMHYLLDAEGRHSLDAMARNFLGYSPVPIEELIGKGRTQISMAQVPDDQIRDYAAEDADITLQLFEKFRTEVDMELYLRIEEPLIRVLTSMEREGVSLDVEVLKVAEDELSKRVVEIESEIKELSAGNEININSPKQLGELLFDTLKLDPKAKKTKTGQYKTDEATLEKLRATHPIVDKIMDYRGIKKLLSTYIEALPQLINPATGRIHTSFNQALTATGRLSSSNPNLQNIPIREALGRGIRRAFVPRGEGWKFIAADYSQVELRIMAHLSEDKNLIQAFLDGKDIHTATAAHIYRVPLAEVTSEQRRRAKTANFGIIYGISTFGLASRLSISRGEATELIGGYFESYPAVKDYMERVKSEAREQGYVQTLFGRRRYLSDINSTNHTMRSLAERNAINAPIQGTAADIMKLAMIGIFSELSRLGLGARMVLQIHDEVIVECPCDEVALVSGIIEAQMRGAASLRVPLDAAAGVGDNWLEVK
ncbi:MAG: DNA polymerase I [Rikenellaceae bacterium]